MLNSPILDVAIVLSFTYFMLSLIVTSLNEILLTKLSLRGKLLKESILKLFFDPAWPAKATEILDSPHITSLQRDNKKDKHFPSYIPAVNFISAIVDCIRSEAKASNKLPANGLLDMNTIKEVITDKTNNLPKEFRISLISMFERASGDLQKFESEIEGFYNNTMDRVTGWYKRHTNKWVFIISFIIVVICNVDSVFIAKKLWGDPDKLISIADNISKQAKDKNIIIKDSLTVSEVMALNKSVSSMGIPMGWNKENAFCDYVQTSSAPFNGFVNALIKLGGWLMTAFALMLGAPFWFDLLNKFVNIRDSGKKPGDSTPAGDKYLSQTMNSVGTTTVG